MVPSIKVIFVLLCLLTLSACTTKADALPIEDRSASSDVSSFQASLKKEALDKNKGNYQTDIHYQQLVADPHHYIKKRIRFSGKISAILTGSEYSLCHLQIDEKSSQTILLTIPDEQLAQQPLSQGDDLTIYGVSEGHFTYQAPSGSFITLPVLEVRLFELKS